jgi:hypothetical protein
MARAILLVAVLAFTLSACEETDSEMKSLEAVIQSVRIGASPGSDQWMEFKNSAGEWERVALVFGYWDDYEGCKDIIDIVGKVNYARQYRCVPAN